MKVLSQPKSFKMIFFLEMWERFGFYGLQALIVLYMVQKLQFTDTQADILFATFSALVFLPVAVGGFIGDRILGTKRTIVLGTLILASGYLLLSIPGLPPATLTLALAIVSVGNAFFKANPSSLLSKAYESTTYNRDSGFTLYYMAVNLGSFISMTLAPVLSQYYGWHAGFITCFIGLILALVSYFTMNNHVKTLGSDPDLKPLRWHYLFLTLLLAIGMVGLAWFLLNHTDLMGVMLAIGVIVLFSFFTFELVRADRNERKGMFLFLVLFTQAIVYFVLYFQMPTSLTLFALRNVEHSLTLIPSVLSIPISAAQFQSLNPFWILVMSPILAVVYHHLSRKNKDLSLPGKFSLGVLLTGSGFLLFPLVDQFSSTGVVSAWWMVLSYGLQSTGELLVSALGLSLVARFVPQRLMGYTMGLWFLCTSIASVIAGKVASLASIPKNISNDPLLSLPIYNKLFLQIGLVTCIVAALMGLLVPILKKLAQHEAGPSNQKLDLYVEEVQVEV